MKRAASAGVMRFVPYSRGLYSRWLQGQGGAAHVVLQRERLFFGL
ncbi:cellulose synthase operon protein D [Klebsiella michiganensis]|uniref:Cellulose synthase operon protein D n=1 Tax=Klebsiella michiganensis TaxID=1134687 RepID=A0A7H4PFT4_9ENTR|nr:cellulose synthase operon protein D [Klebsiella michiganensis]